MADVVPWHRRASSDPSIHQVRRMAATQRDPEPSTRHERVSSVRARFSSWQADPFASSAIARFSTGSLRHASSTAVKLIAHLNSLCLD